MLADQRTARQGLQYSASEGYAPLREWIVGHMASRGVAILPAVMQDLSGFDEGVQGIRYAVRPGIHHGERLPIAGRDYRRDSGEVDAIG